MKHSLTPTRTTKGTWHVLHIDLEDINDGSMAKHESLNKHLRNEH